MLFFEFFPVCRCSKYFSLRVEKYIIKIMQRGLKKSYGLQINLCYTICWCWKQFAHIGWYSMHILWVQGESYSWQDHCRAAGAHWLSLTLYQQYLYPRPDHPLRFHQYLFLILLHWFLTTPSKLEDGEAWKLSISSILPHGHYELPKLRKQWDAKQNLSSRSSRTSRVVWPTGEICISNFTSPEKHFLINIKSILAASLRILEIPADSKFTYKEPLILWEQWSFGARGMLLVDLSFLWPHLGLWADCGPHFDSPCCLQKVYIAETKPANSSSKWCLWSAQCWTTLQPSANQQRSLEGCR